jgi:hypothetical protein
MPEPIFRKLGMPLMLPEAISVFLHHSLPNLITASESVEAITLILYEFLN